MRHRQPALEVATGRCRATGRRIELGTGCQRVVGFFVIRWNLGILPKLLIVTAASFALVVILHELLVRRFNGIRFLFGMKPRTKARAAIGATSDAAPC